MTPSLLTTQEAVLGLGIGLVFGLMCYLVTNLSPGGMITPGWLAITLVEDVTRLVIIAAVVGLAYGGARLLRRVVILFGKRLFAAVVLLAVFAQATIFLFLLRGFPQLAPDQTLGFIVPGLIAYQLLRQPVVPTAIAVISVTGVTYGVLAVGVVLGFLQG